MTDIRTLQTITRNLLALWIARRHNDLETYREALREGLNPRDYASVEQAYKHRLAKLAPVKLQLIR